MPAWPRLLLSGRSSRIISGASALLRAVAMSRVPVECITNQMTR